MHIILYFKTEFDVLVFLWNIIIKYNLKIIKLKIGNCIGINVLLHNLLYHLYNKTEKLYNLNDNI